MVAIMPIYFAARSHQMPSNQALTTKFFGDASEEKLVRGTLGDWMPAQQASAPEANDGEETAGLANTLILVAEEASMLGCGWFVSKLLITQGQPPPAFAARQRARCSAAHTATHTLPKHVNYSTDLLFNFTNSKVPPNNAV